jgi:hypothetical protein
MTNTSTLLKGQADVRIAPAASHLTTYTRALTSANSLGFVGKVSVVKTVEEIVRKVCRGRGPTSRVYPIVIGNISELVTVSLDISSFSTSNLNAILGDPTEVTDDQDVIADSLPLLFNGGGEFRVEVASVYSHGANCLSIVIPSMVISRNMTLDFSPGGFISQPLLFTSLPVINSVWANEPTGRLIIS